MKEDTTLLTITRYNRERGIGIFGNFVTGQSQSDVMDFLFCFLVVVWKMYNSCAAIRDETQEK